MANGDKPDLLKVSGMSDQDKSHQSEIFALMNGDVRMWIEQEVIHLVAFDRPYHDPVELTTEMARELAAKLREMADKIGD